MTPTQYFEKIIGLYHDSRYPKFNNGRIYRGRSTSISSALEDLTAFFIAQNLDGKQSYFIDQSMKFNGLTKCPDIVIQQPNGLINNIIDIKTDLGWRRNKMIEYSKEWNNLVEDVKGNNVAFKNGVNKRELNGQFSDDLKLHVVIASLKNSGNKIVTDSKQIETDFPNIELYILSEGLHPNNYKYSKKETLNKIKIRYDEFEKLIRNLS